MKLHNLKLPQQQVTFKQAVIQGIGRKRGLFFVDNITAINDINGLLAMDFVNRSVSIMHHLITGEIDRDTLGEMIEAAFNFKVPVQHIDQNISCLELFHGQTLAFKDFGARFMAQCIKKFNDQEHVTILTATSGDTGAAVAHAFYKIDGIKVKILYPKGKISPLQEKLFCTLGENIETYAIEGDFDDCQRMVKAAFDSQSIRDLHHLTSANSINISRLFAQVCYYFELVSQLSGGELVVAVPSGNFGNLTAGVIAKQCGAPIKRFIAATNANDTVPRYLMNKVWAPQKTIETASNAMDVSDPSNWPRIMALFNDDIDRVRRVVGASIKSDEQTYRAMKELQQKGYVAEPHSAIAYAALKESLLPKEKGAFIATAHPAKFIETVESVLQQSIDLPDTLAQVENLDNLSITMSNDSQAFNNMLLANGPS